jgi:hypothetical protein
MKFYRFAVMLAVAMFLSATPVFIHNAAAGMDCPCCQAMKTCCCKDKVKKCACCKDMAEMKCCSDAMKKGHGCKDGKCPMKGHMPDRATGPYNFNR